MENKKRATAESPFYQPLAPNTGASVIVPPKCEEVKRDSPLRQLRLESNVPVSEMVNAVRSLYPGYDKPLHSKVENGSRYGVQLRPDAERLLFARYAGIVRRKHADAHRKKPCRECMPGSRKTNTTRCNGF